MSDIVKRLRDKAFIGGPTMDAAHTKKIEWVAADEIERLREENARLRVALKPFAEMELWTDAYPDGPLSATTKERFVDPLWIVAARTAIREGGK